MNDSKPWYASKTVWASIVPVAMPFIVTATHNLIGPGDTQLIIDTLSAAGLVFAGAVAIYGRLTAQAAIGGPTNNTAIGGPTNKSAIGGLTNKSAIGGLTDKSAIGAKAPPGLDVKTAAEKGA